jgi:hypothetical protein
VPSAYNFNKDAPVMDPCRVPRRILFSASKSTTMFTVRLAKYFSSHGTGVMIAALDALDDSAHGALWRTYHRFLVAKGDAWFADSARATVLGRFPIDGPS